MIARNLATLTDLFNDDFYLNVKTGYYSETYGYLQSKGLRM